MDSTPRDAQGGQELDTAILVAALPLRMFSDFKCYIKAKMKQRISFL